MAWAPALASPAGGTSAACQCTGVSWACRPGPGGSIMAMSRDVFVPPLLDCAASGKMESSLVAACTGVCSCCTSHGEFISLISGGVFRLPPVDCAASGTMESSLVAACSCCSAHDEFISLIVRGVSWPPSSSLLHQETWYRP